MSQTEQPWSYHTFILPFTAKAWPQAAGPGNTAGNSASQASAAGPQPCAFALAGSAASASQSPVVRLDPKGWRLISRPGDCPPPEFETGAADGIVRLIRQYNAFQYFTEPARALVFGREGSDRKPGSSAPPLAQHFDLLPGGQSLASLNAKYVIEHQACKYELDLVRVRLVTYSTSVSVLVIETEYRGENHTLADIKRINEYGRRVCFPFIPGGGPPGSATGPGDPSPALRPQGGHPVTADYISMPGLPGFTRRDLDRANPQERYVADFVWDTDSEGWDNVSFRYLMEPIKGLLSEWSDKEASSNPAHLADSPDRDKKFLVHPLMDDRMFVCCLFRDDALSQRVKQWNPSPAGCGGGQYSVFSPDPADDATAGAFYSFAFIDTGEPTCQSRNMRPRIMSEAVYDRWIDYGTLYAFARHSFVCLVNENLKYTEDVVIAPFSNIYLEMVIMALVQKASTLQMSGLAADLADAYDPNQDDDASAALTARITALQQQNAIVQNQLILSEVTNQEQGVEMFNLLRRQLGVESSNRELIEQLDYLHRISTEAAEQRRRKEAEEEAKRDQERGSEAEQRGAKINRIVVTLGLAAVASAVMDVCVPLPSAWSCVAIAAVAVAWFFLWWFVLRRRPKSSADPRQPSAVAPADAAPGAHKGPDLAAQ